MIGKKNIVLILILMLLSVSGISIADITLYVEPSAGDIQQSGAVEIAKAVLIENYEDMDMIINNSTVDASFGYLIVEYEEPIWVVGFSNPQVYYGSYYVMISKQGDILSYQAPHSPSYGPNDDELTDTIFTEPGLYDITEEEAIKTAMNLIHEIKDFETRLDKLTTKAFFLYGERYNHGWEPVWLVYFYQNNDLQQKMLLGYDGSYIDCVSADKKFIRVQRNDDGLGEIFLYQFSDMTVEEKAAFSEKWVPIVEEYIKTHPYYPNRNDQFYKATRQTFGIPEEGHISQAEATKIAKKAILQMGASEQTLDQRKIGYSFDISDPLRPMWVLVFYHTSMDEPHIEPTPDGILTCEIKIDAITGAVDNTFVYNGEGSFDGFYY